MNSLEIKEFRKKYNLTQSDLADIVGSTIRAVQSWEQGNRNITQSAIKLISNFISEQEFKSRLVVDPDSPWELMRKDYLELASSLMKDNKQLRKEIKELMKENASLRAKLLSND